MNIRFLECSLECAPQYSEDQSDYWKFVKLVMEYGVQNTPKFLVNTQTQYRVKSNNDIVWIGAYTCGVCRRLPNETQHRFKWAFHPNVCEMVSVDSIALNVETERKLKLDEYEQFRREEDSTNLIHNRITNWCSDDVCHPASYEYLKTWVNSRNMNEFRLPMYSWVDELKQTYGSKFKHILAMTNINRNFDDILTVLFTNEWTTWLKGEHELNQVLYYVNEM